MPTISDEAFKIRRNPEVWEFFLIPNTQVFHGSFLKKEAVELHQTVTAWFCLCLLRSACMCQYATVTVRLGANRAPPCKSFAAPAGFYS